MSNFGPSWAFPLAIFLVPALGSAGEQLPLTTEVSVAQGPVFSGPSEDYYVTTRLPRGARVEVHRLGADGWLAIRPPEGSFSWVAADHIRPSADGSLGEVVAEGVVSWIGSELPAVKNHRWLVQLEQGEVVELLQRQDLVLHADAEPKQFYRIAPPAGEFRWIRETDVRTARDSGTTNSNSASLNSDSATLALAEFRVIERDAAEQPPRRDGFVARRTSRPTEAPPRIALRDSRSPAQLTPEAKPLDDRAFLRHMRDLDLQLALEVTRPPETWDLGPLRRALKQLDEQAQSTLQRARAKVVLERLAEFETLQQRYAVLNGPALPGAELPDKLFGGRPPPRDDDRTPNAAATPDGRPSIDPRFDGTGWLLPVHSSSLGSPPYALLDREGQILQFVSPAPGINLHRYLRSEVGIYGQRDFLPQLKKGHITAHRVVDLQRHRR